MALTHVECSFYRSSSASGERSSFVALNPRGEPGALVVGVAEAARASLGSQVACKLGLEHFVSGMLEASSWPALEVAHYSQNTARMQEPHNSEPHNSESRNSALILESSFKAANSAVYEFGHKLSAGGRLSAALLGLIVEDRTVSAARVGSAALYLVREQQIFPFFELRPEIGPNEPLVGSQSLLAVELSSVPAYAGDVLILVPGSLTLDEQQELISTVSQVAKHDFLNLAQTIAEKVMSERESISFIFATRLGPETIYLSPRLAT